MILLVWSCVVFFVAVPFVLCWVKEKCLTSRCSIILCSSSCLIMIMVINPNIVQWCFSERLQYCPAPNKKDVHPSISFHFLSTFMSGKLSRSDSYQTRRSFVVDHGGTWRTFDGNSVALWNSAPWNSAQISLRKSISCLVATWCQVRSPSFGLLGVVPVPIRTCIYIYIHVYMLYTYMYIMLGILYVAYMLDI